MALQVYKEHKPCDILDPSLGLQLWCSRFYVQAHRQLWHAEYKQHNTCIKKWQTWSHFNQSSDHNTVGDGCLRSLPFGRDGIKLSDSHTHTPWHAQTPVICALCLRVMGVTSAPPWQGGLSLSAYLTQACKLSTAPLDCSSAWLTARKCSGFSTSPRAQFVR